MTDCMWSSDFQIYCNYPDISKTIKTPMCLEESESVYSISLSSILPSCISDVSDPLSQPNIFYNNKYSSSICNYFKCSLSCEKSYDENVNEEIEFDWNSKDELETENSFISSSVEQSGIIPNKSVYKISTTTPHLEDWLNCATDQDPWNVMHYNLIVENKIPSQTSILTHELISTCSSEIGQLPDSKSFVLTRLHINKKGLEDISILYEYKYFQYVDVSWNYLTDLKGLSSLNYLMYLNASHNKLSTVLDFLPPWFLTYIDLSCNEIKDIGRNLASFWSLCHIDLSYNLIEKIEGLGELRYLRYLNLSHNRIRRIEKLDCFNIEELNLEFNEISNCDLEDMSFQGLTQIKILSMGHNKMTSLLPFEQLYSLNKLDIHHNCLENLNEINCLAGLPKLYEVNLSENVFCSTCSYRELVIFKIPSLRTLDLIFISSNEQVSAKMLFGPDMFTSIQHLRTKVELWNQLAPQEIGSETMPFDALPVPLVVLVGTFLNKKEEIAQYLILKFPKQMYRFKKYTTIPSSKNYETANLISVSVDQFNTMIKNGSFLIHYKEAGFSFGVFRDELCKCILDSRIGLTEMPLEAAMVLKLSGLYPLMILTHIENIEGYADQLRCSYMNLELWNFQGQIFAEECNMIDKNPHRTKNDLFVSHEKKQFCQNKIDSLCSTTSELSTYLSSIQSSMENLREFTNNKVPDNKSSNFGKSVTWNFSNSSKETDGEESIRASQSPIPSALSKECQFKINGEVETLTFEDGEENLQLKEDCQDLEISSNKNTCEVYLPKYYNATELKDSMDGSELQSTSSYSKSILDETKSEKSNANFEWIWTYESSTTTESEPSENCLNMVKGREKFVRNTLIQQDLYIEANQLQPALFILTVPSDDTQSTIPKIDKACRDILKSRENYKHIEDLTIELSSSKLIEERLSNVMKDFYNIPTNVQF